MDEELPTVEVEDATLLSDPILDSYVLWLIHYKNQIVMELIYTRLTTLQGLVTNE